jgi:hypothetical protein
MQIVQYVSRPGFHALSNGALAFAASQILCGTGKWSKLFTGSVLAFNLYFQQLGLNLQGQKVHHCKER